MCTAQHTYVRIIVPVPFSFQEINQFIEVMGKNYCHKLKKNKKVSLIIFKNNQSLGKKDHKKS